MSNNLMLDVGQANEIKLAFRRAHFTNDDIKKLCQGTILTGVRSVILGHASITMREHIIDCDACPYVPLSKDGWTVESHQKNGQFHWDTERQKNCFYISSDQLNEKGLGGNELRNELSGKPVLNACVLDYLLANTHLIPDEFKGTYMFFWGTIYKGPHGGLYVRCLCWKDGHWDSEGDWLNSHFRSFDAAALSVQ